MPSTPIQPSTVYDSSDDLQIIDVREPQEWTAGRIESAVHIPMGDIVNRLDLIDRDRLVVTVCRSGHRSEQVADYLTEAGFTVNNLEGGLQRWAQQGLPVVTSAGEPGRVA